MTTTPHSHDTLLPQSRRQRKSVDSQAAYSQIIRSGTDGGRVAVSSRPHSDIGSKRGVRKLATSAVYFQNGEKCQNRRENLTDLQTKRKKSGEFASTAGRSGRPNRPGCPTNSSQGGCPLLVGGPAVQPLVGGFCPAGPIGTAMLTPTSRGYAMGLSGRGLTKKKGRGFQPHKVHDPGLFF